MVTLLSFQTGITDKIVRDDPPSLDNIVIHNYNKVPGSVDTADD